LFWGMPDLKTESITEPLGRVTYYLALLFVLTPAIDFVANVLPLQPSHAQWRYGTVGLLSGFLLTPFLGLLLANLAASGMRHSRLLRFLGVIELAVGVILLGCTALFVLDMLEVRSAVPQNARATFDIGSVKALGKNVTGAIALLWLGVASFRTGLR